ncbi:RDD family protein [Bosea sp. R86505]|uniref:RDD family protein n=1 Tax=Bosea sp. R86505 TaxID=3101710 RepID=UPI00366FA7FA
MGAYRSGMRAVGITPKTLVCVVGATEWTEAGSVPFLAGMFAERAPPLPPMATALPPAPTADVRITQNQGQYGGYPQPATAGNVRYAGFWIRTGAYLLDVVFLFLLMIIPVTIVIMITGDPNSGLGTIVTLFVGICYYVVPVSGPTQATWGKQMVGLKIIRVDGAPVSGGLAFGRYLSYIISGIPFGIGFFMVGWTNQKKGLHDMICGTRVIHKA